MNAGRWGQHPEYNDPDEIYAAHMIQASWHLQKAGGAELSEACAAEAAKAFADITPDKKTGRKKLGRAWYDPSGLIGYDMDQNDLRRICVSGPAFVSDGQEEPAGPDEKADMKQFLKSINKRYPGYESLSWFAQNQLKSTLQGRTFRPGGTSLSCVLTGLQKVSDTWHRSMDDQTATTACKDAVNKIMEKTPAAGSVTAMSSLAHNNNADWYYSLKWLPQAALDQLSERRDAILGCGHEIFSDVLRQMNDMKCIARWPQEPPGTLLEDGIEALKRQVIGKGGSRHEPTAFAICSILSQALDRGRRTWALCQAYRTLSGVPDKDALELFRSIGILSKDTSFEPSDDLWADVAILSFDSARLQYLVKPDSMEEAMPRLNAAETAFREWLSGEDIRKAVKPDQALSYYDIPQPEPEQNQTHEKEATDA